ncbi:hypothetical protein [Nonomuraea sp. NPDC052265]|uniref:hypothetical protein n=1 Tax=Nonomuraea sp. NPDC052265 TaxID=3364374 RepID=UPI0037C8BFDF
MTFAGNWDHMEPAIREAYQRFDALTEQGLDPGPDTDWRLYGTYAHTKLWLSPQGGHDYDERVLRLVRTVAGRAMLAEEYGLRLAGMLPLLRHWATADTSAPGDGWLPVVCDLLTPEAIGLVHELVTRLAAYRGGPFVCHHAAFSWSEDRFLKAGPFRRRAACCGLARSLTNLGSRRCSPTSPSPAAPAMMASVPPAAVRASPTGLSACWPAGAGSRPSPPWRSFRRGCGWRPYRRMSLARSMRLPTRPR